MLACALFLFLLAYTHAIQVNTTEGPVVGSKSVEGDYFAFYGIPYAGPTSGPNRFKAPVAPSHRSGVFHASDSNIFCAQPTGRGLVGAEDCLTLNVFTKNTTSVYPVIVWLNSEEYTTSNTQMLSVRRLVEHKIVFVTLNFRLSIFGFLCLGVQDAPGNAGLRDVIQGLKWIKSNIGNFGGDANNVVLMGHASGGAMVDLLTLSPQIENLAHKAVVLSGSGLAQWAVAYDPIGYAQRLGEKLGYEGKNPEKLAKLLVNTDVYVLQTALNEFQFYNNTPLFAPCVENPKLRPNDTFLGDAPINILKSGKYAQIPVIYGYTNEEGTMRADEADNKNWLDLMQTNFTSFLPVDFQLKDHTAFVSDAIREHYFSNATISMGLINDFLQYEGDILVLYSVIKTAKLRAATSKSDIRLIELAYLGTRNSHWIYNRIPLSGAAHGAFMNYLFEDDLRPEDEPISKAIVGRFAGFAHNWPNGTLDIIGTHNNTKVGEWLPITKKSTNYLYYTGNGAPTVNNTFYREEQKFAPHYLATDFWDTIYSIYYVAPGPNSSSATLSCVLFVMFCQLVLRLF